jgi:hypothetical protein
MELPQHGSDHEEGCTFLGRHGQYDLWWSGQGGFTPTIIARWSSDGPDYSSGIAFGWIEDQPDNPLVEARKRAETLGLDVQREIYAGKMKRHANGIYYTEGSESDMAELFGDGND